MNDIFSESYSKGEHTKTNLNIQMSEYNYLGMLEQERKRKNKMMLVMLLSGMVMIAGILIIGGVMNIINAVFLPAPIPPSTLLRDFIELAGVSTQMSWSSFAKFFLVLMMPVIALSWIFRGVQVRLLA